MPNKKTPREIKTARSTKLLVLYVLFIILIYALLSSVYNTIQSDRHIPTKTATIQDRSLRGDIISQDNYTISSSYKLYQATVHAQSIAPDKKELFIELFSIYSGIPKDTIKQSFYNKNGRLKHSYVTLSDTIDAKRAILLKSLAIKLRKLDVFKPIKNRHNIEVLYGLDVIECGEARSYPIVQSMTPIIGYVKEKRVDRYTLSQGMKGLERYAEKHLVTRKDGLFHGQRDVIGSVIRNGDSTKENRIDGLDLHLNIPLRFQQRVEQILDYMKIETDAQEILAAVMESKTGKVLAIASSERYNPSHITQKDVSALNPKFAEYPYEAGSVIKPLTLAIALDQQKVTPQTWFDTHNGRMSIGKRQTITDDDKFKSLTATDIIVHSSNVGISQISWRLTGEEFRKGLLDFGLSQPSGIDLSRDLPGKVKSLKLLNNKMHRANQSYGYGMHATFAQLIKAYSAFNNNGKAMTPRIVDYFSDKKGNNYRLPPPQADKQAISKKTANQIKNILKEVVKRGTGIAAQYRGLEIGGKTGTAHIATASGYSNLYHSSFYGFANDKSGEKNYTIGVLVIKAKKPYKYFASQSAVPTFKKITHALVEYQYLEPVLTAEEQALEDEEYKKAHKNNTEHVESQPSNSTYKPHHKKFIKEKVLHKPKPRVYKPKEYTDRARVYTPKPKPKPAQKRQEALFNDLDMF